jgi:hypothetical protein
MPDPTRAFDFWIGEWEVHDPSGTHVGRSSITAPFGNGTLAEHWRGDSGAEGRSLNAWDPDRGCWHQTWMDAAGGVLLLDGDLRDGAMVLEGITADARHRITWRSEGAGVRQLWETTKDDGQSWETVFDGRYSPA